MAEQSGRPSGFRFRFWGARPPQRPAAPPQPTILAQRPPSVQLPSPPTATAQFRPTLQPQPPAQIPQPQSPSALVSQSQQEKKAETSPAASQPMSPVSDQGKPAAPQTLSEGSLQTEKPTEEPSNLLTRVTNQSSPGVGGLSDIPIQRMFSEKIEATEGVKPETDSETKVEAPVDERRKPESGTGPQATEDDMPKKESETRVEAAEDEKQKTGVDSRSEALEEEKLQTEMEAKTEAAEDEKPITESAETKTEAAEVDSNMKTKTELEAAGMETKTEAAEVDSNMETKTEQEAAGMETKTEAAEVDSDMETKTEQEAAGMETKTEAAEVDSDMETKTEQEAAGMETKTEAAEGDSNMETKTELEAAGTETKTEAAGGDSDMETQKKPEATEDEKPMTTEETAIPEETENVQRDGEQKPGRSEDDILEKATSSFAESGSTTQPPAAEMISTGANQTVIELKDLSSNLEGTKTKTLIASDPNESITSFIDSTSQGTSLYESRGDNLNKEGDAKVLSSDEEGGSGGRMDQSRNEIKSLPAFINSNMQSINNSIMFNSSYSEKSPGVHLVFCSNRTGQSNPMKTYGAHKAEIETTTPVH